MSEIVITAKSGHHLKPHDWVTIVDGHNPRPSLFEVSYVKNETQFGIKPVIGNRKQRRAAAKKASK